MAIVTTSFTLCGQDSSLDMILDSTEAKLEKVLLVAKNEQAGTQVSQAPSGIQPPPTTFESTQVNGLVTEAVVTQAQIDPVALVQNDYSVELFGGMKIAQGAFLNGELDRVVVTDPVAGVIVTLDGKMLFNGAELGTRFGGLVTTMSSYYLTHIQIKDLATSKSLDFYGNFGSDGVVGLTGTITSLVYQDGIKSYIKDDLAINVANPNGTLNKGRVLDIVNKLLANVEKVVLHGDMGKSLNDVILGDVVDEFISGGLGNDKLIGGGGVDILDGGAGNDQLFGGDDGNDLRGGAGKDKLVGGAWDDIISGGVEMDVLIGNEGDDTYYIEDNADGKVKKDGTVGKSTVDKIVEKMDGGIDTVVTRISYILPSNVENLTLKMGAGNIDGTGNKLDNVITGNQGVNILNGKDGWDILTGGAGKDVFVFDTRIKPVMVDGDLIQINIDTITDFGAGDSIHLSKKIFSAYKIVGADLSADFVSGPGSVAQDATDHFIYDTNDGALYYDPDGNGVKDPLQVLILENVYSLKASELHIL